ncbi:hypothetical protein EYC80_002683 [Monilinia laxa]|uniref:Uncharacterized protein n=1 Tax=Monilinia laxa TaxID=61186 RepID=A0A5N6K4Q2_MONLA|nr:hypothetical protein EYC80_002683 [Monilinia laxa]
MSNEVRYVQISWTEKESVSLLRALPLEGSHCGRRLVESQIYGRLANQNLTEGSHLRKTNGTKARVGIGNSKINLAEKCLSPDGLEAWGPSLLTKRIPLSCSILTGLSS